MQEPTQAHATLEPAKAIRRSLALYRSQPLGIRAFVTIRHWLAPLARVLAAVPASGRVLDVGCGHGMFGCAAALGSPGRSVLGVDPSPDKITVATSVGVNVPNARFVQGIVQDVAERDFDAITILDVLYLLPVEEKLAVLRACRERIAPSGVLIVKANDTRPAWKYAVARGQEALMTTIGLTMGHGALHFLSREENAELISRAGFSPRFVDLNSWLPYPHVMFVCRPA
jgi:2-polyprenyl-6-hydroxyphenyl methylase/3-demethylubiquinone-9 3-methyltransferase